MPVCIKCDTAFPNRMVVDGKTRNLQRRKYCVTCSPFGDHNTAKLHEERNRSCSDCGDSNPDNFYSSSRKSLCKGCHNKYTIRKGQEKRLYAIDKLGGKCSCCGYDKYPCSLDIHHTDPSVKDENFSSFRGWSIDRIDREIASCILLCKNCHQAHHSGYIAEEELYRF